MNVNNDASNQPKQNTVFKQIGDNSYKFLLGSIAGACGVTVIYPIDLVKTRMQNQRFVINKVDGIVYKNSFDCFRKVLVNEGIIGLYRGLAPQFIGVCPEKAIKLTVNDFMRDKLKNDSGKITLLAEIISGCTAGAAQVFITNPLEIVKIRLQVAGEEGKILNAFAVMKEIGLVNLYKGASACYLRVVPFAGIYFPIYANCKKYFASEDGYNTPGSLMFSAIIASQPPALLLTPADVIKTRMQVIAREGQTSYNGLLDTIRKIWNEEGFNAFWKGAGTRMVRSCGQYGTTIFAYEMLQRWF